MSYEAFREQCAKTIELCDDAMMAHDDYVLDPSECAGIVRALPLPEVKQQPVAIISRNDRMMESWKVAVRVLADRDRIPHGNSYLYLASTDAEALRKENEQLRYLLGRFCDVITKNELGEPRVYPELGHLVNVTRAVFKGTAG